MQYGIKQYIFVIRELTVREIKRKYSRSVLGILWSVLQPLLFMLIMSLVFTGFSLNSGEFPVYYITGYTLWAMFSTATTTSMTSFEDNSRLFQKTKLPREIFVLSRVYTALVNLLFSCVAMVLVLVFFRIRFTFYMFLFPLSVILEVLFSIGISFLLATIYVFYKDIKFIWKNILIWVVHMIAVFIPIERYPERLHKITRMNPLFIYGDVARKSVLYGQCDLKQIRDMFIWAFASFIFGILIFKLKENEMVKIL